MSWFTQTLSGTIGRKLLMAITGLFLIIFLVVHMSGNMLLLKGDGGEAFNLYAKFMTSNALIRVASIILYTGIIVHVVWSILLTRKNQAARPSKYAYEKASTNSSWNSRNMGILGTFILLFLVAHMKQFWFEMHFGAVPMKSYNGVEAKDLYAVVVVAFQQWWYVALYIVSLGFLGFHLLHGFQSAFQTLGLYHKKYTPLIKTVGTLYSIIIPILFAIQPLYILLFKG